ncbi:MAG: glutamine synthetase [Acidimicrobiia bacterium]
MDQVRVVWPDHLGLARGKYLPTSHARQGLTHQSIAAFTATFDHHLVEEMPSAERFLGLPDLEVRFDPDDVRNSWIPDTGVVVADLYDGDEPLPLSPRHALRKAVSDWSDLGFKVQIGCELEFFVMEPDGAGGWQRWNTPDSFGYATGLAADPVGLLDAIGRAGRESGLGAEAISSEESNPQFEFSLDRAEGTAAIDNAFLFRIMAREVAQEMGFLVTFMGRPFADRSGCGLHVNFSLWDSEGRNALADDGRRGGISELAERCIAGLLARHSSMAGLTAPTVNAYKRLAPGELSGYWATWGFDHRFAAVRIPPDRDEGLRIEHRSTDAAANPYLAAAAILHAARMGVIDELDPPPPEEGPGVEADAETGRIPDSLAEGLDALEADRELVEAVGAELIENYLVIKRLEWDLFRTHITDWELAHYLPYV